MKQTMTMLLVLVVGACFPVASAPAGEPAPPRRARFASKPGASAEGKGVRISFAAASACDAEVTVLGADGKEVRHLAAGLLGAKEAAAPLAPGKLAQSLLWDRKDDWGRPAAGTAFKVRVRLGMRAAGARPVLKALKGDKPYRIVKIVTEPDPAEAGRPGLTAQEQTTKEGKALARLGGYSWLLMADREDDRIYAKHLANTWYRYIGATGKAEPFDTKKFLKYGEHFRIGPGGEIHINPLRKLTRDLKEIPPLEDAPQRERCNRFSMLLWCRWRSGPFVEHWRTANQSPEPGLDGRYYMYITVSKPISYFCVFDRWENKRALREGFQPWVSGSGKSQGGHFGSLRVDTKGKVYIASGGAPMGTKLHDGRPCPKIWGSKAKMNAYGSILRLNLDERWVDDFPLPMGAPSKDPEELKKGILWNNGVFAPRVEKCYPVVMSWLLCGCTCSGSTFDLDEHGRLYVPDAGRESVVVLDNAGNEVLRLKKTVPAGADGKGTAYYIGWPHRSVACTRKAIYFGEGLSRRVIRVALGYAAEASCKLP